MSRVTLSKISKSYGSLEVVHAIDLEVKHHEFVVLVGPSGCGKSTTLRMIAGLEEISGGELKIGDRIVNEVAPKDRDVAMVFQNYALYPHLNVKDNIAFGLRIRRESKEAIKKSVDDVGEILGLTDLLHRKPSELSGGQRQRVAMGRAIVRHPEVFLFDEPLSNLDAQLRTQMRAEIKRLHNRLGVTSIYVTHDQVEAMTLADRIVVMQDGIIEQVGTPMELFLNPKNTFVAGFLGSPPMNQIKAKLVNAEDGPKAQIGDQLLPLAPLKEFKHLDDKDIIIGIRPEYTNVCIGKDKEQIHIEIELVETLGSEALIHSTVAGKPFVMKSETLTGMGDLNSTTGFTIDPELIRVFDADTGLAFPGQDRKA
jgi:multiple sugar transport system ATP-binding protein